MKEKTYQTVTEKKILKILINRDKLSKNKIMSLAKMPRKRCIEYLDALVKDQYVTNLQNERYEITELGIHYLDEMTKRDKRVPTIEKPTFWTKSLMGDDYDVTSQKKKTDTVNDLGNLGSSSRGDQTLKFPNPP